MITARGTLQARIFWALALVTVIAASVPALLSRDTLYQERIALAEQETLSRIAIIGSILESGADTGQIAALLDSVKKTGSRMTVTEAGGKVIHDSHVGGDALLEMDNHGDRPEIEAAREQGQGVSLRHSNTLGIDAMYAAMMLSNGETVRLAVPMATIRQSLEKELSTISVTVICVAGLCLLLSIFLTARFRKGIDTLAEVVAAIARDKGSKRLMQVPGKEFLPLAHAVNGMAANVEKYLATATDQRGQLEIILDSIHEGILVLGPSGNIRRYNRAAVSLFPSLEDAMGMQIIDGIPVPSLQRRVEELLKDVPPEDAPLEEEALHFERDGRFLVAHISRPVEKNQSLGAVIVVYDASHIMRLERVRRDFIANISHEIRTPLTAISGYAETLKNLEELAPEHKHFAGIIHKHAQALGKVISDLLALARIEDAKEKVQLSPVEPMQPLAEAMRLCAEQAENKGVRFTVAVDENARIMGNASLLTQVFRNLLENACRYTPDNDEVVISGEVKDGAMLFAVKDRGPGIPREELTRIFERLYQVKKQRNSGSSGLGLAISKHIIERHGGSIWTESPYSGFATAMLFTIPLESVSS